MMLVLDYGNIEKHVVPLNYKSKMIRIWWWAKGDDDNDDDDDDDDDDEEDDDDDEKVIPVKLIDQKCHKDKGSYIEPANLIGHHNNLDQ